MRSVFLSAMVLVVACVTTYAAEPASLNIAEENFQLYTDFFGDVVRFMSLPNQAPMMKLMPQIEPAHRQKYGGKPPETLIPQIRELYEETRAHFMVIPAVCEGDTITWSDDVKAYVTRGVDEAVILQITNANPHGIAMKFSTEGPVPPGNRGYMAMPGQTIPLFIPLHIKEPADALDIHFALLHREADGSIIDRTTKTPLKLNLIEPGIIRGQLLDSDTGEVFPGRISVHCSDGIVRHAKAYDANTTMREKKILSMALPIFMYKLPFCYSDGRFEIAVPPGETKIVLERGYEHDIVSKSVNVASGETCKVDISSGRFLDMRSLGWFSGDTHVHWVENRWYVNESLDLMSVVQRAEDVRVINNLTLRHDQQWGTQFVAPSQFPMGPAPGYCDDQYHIEMAEEYRNDTLYGHLVFLNLKELVWPITTGQAMMGPNALDWPTNDWAIRQARAQGGIVGQAHGLQAEGAADIAAGIIDTVDQLSAGEYYGILDSGFRVSLTNGSDHPARVVGVCRAYVKVDGDFTYQRWVDGIRAGRTFTTSGPLLFLTVNGQDIGSELTLSQGDTVTVHVKAVSRHPLGNVEVLMNRNLIVDAETDECTFEATVEVPVEKSAWVAARVSTDDRYNALYHEGIAHTSATYLIVDGQPIYNPGSAIHYAERLRTMGERVREEGRFETEAQRDEACRVFTDGAGIYEQLVALYEKK